MENAASASIGVADEAESCPTCIEPYKGKKVVKITCQYCPTHACRGCQQRYLLQTYEDPHCMDCKRGWSPEFMAANFPLIFRNDALRKHRRKVLLERERAMLPAMQIYVEYKRECERLTEEIKEMKTTFGTGYGDSGPDTLCASYYKELKAIREKESAIHKLNSEISMPPPPSAVTKYQETINALKIQRDTLVKERAEMLKLFEPLRNEVQEKHQIYQRKHRAQYEAQARYDDRWVAARGAAAGAQQRREFIMKCPEEGCRGFLSSAYKCGTCSKWTCADCLVVIGLEKEGTHTCSEEAKETAKTIKAETKPCPKCGTRIFKLEGCDQMFCVMEGCHTAFSWNSGHIVTGVIHNPHYYEWLRRTGGGAAPAREMGDIPCGGLPPSWRLIRALGSIDLPAATMATLTESHRKITELTERLQDFPARLPAAANKNADVLYLMNRLTELEWQRELELTEAKFKRKKEIGQILQMAAMAVSDIFNRIVNFINEMITGDATGEEQAAVWVVTVAVPELQQLREFVNTSLKELAKREHMAVPQFGENWTWMPLRALYRKVAPTTAAAAAKD